MGGGCTPGVGAEVTARRGGALGIDATGRASSGAVSATHAFDATVSAERSAPLGPGQPVVLRSSIGGGNGSYTVAGPSLAAEVTANARMSAGIGGKVCYAVGCSSGSGVDVGFDTPRIDVASYNA